MKAKSLKIGHLYMFPKHAMYMFEDIEYAFETYGNVSWGPLDYSIRQVYTMGDSAKAYPINAKEVFMVIDRHGMRQYKVIFGDKVGWINVENTKYLKAVSNNLSKEEYNNAS